MPHDSPEPGSAPPRRSLFRRLGLIALGLCLLFGIALFATTLSNRARLRRELKAIEERGEPVVLPTAVETEAGRASREWLRQFDNAEGDENEWSLDRVEGIARFLELPEGRALDAEARTRLEQLAACMGREGGERPDRRAWALLQDGVPPERLDECVRAFLATCELAYPRIQAALHGPIPSEPLDPEPGPGLARIPQHIPWLHSAVQAVLLPTPAMIARGQAAEVSSRIQKALRLTSLYSRQVSQISLLARVLFTETALAVARMTLAQLPAAAALDPIEELLVGIEDQRTQFHRAVLVERAMMNECYAQFIEESGPVGVPHAGAYSALLSFDQPYLLSTFAEVLEISTNDSPVRIGEGLGQLSDRIDAHFESWMRYTTPVAAFLIPRFTDGWSAVQDERAWIDLVRLGLRLRQLAPQDALAEASRSTDPYTEQPFHARIEADRLLAIWSVGRNGQDDGGPTRMELERAGYGAQFERDDLVVRVRLR
jgi:hypothetical protein